jgi:hypothetical protein
MVRSSTSQALRSLSSTVLLQEATAAAFLSSGSIKLTSLPPWGAIKPVAAAAALQAGKIIIRKCREMREAAIHPWHVLGN